MLKMKVRPFLKQIIMPLIKSIQELTVEIEKLKKELELLKQSKE